jgi:hypothetical protein
VAFRDVVGLYKGFFPSASSSGNPIVILRSFFQFYVASGYLVKMEFKKSK